MSKSLLFAALIFAAVFLVHFNSRVVISSDSRWTIPTALSLIHDGNLDLDEFPDAQENDGYSVVRANGHIYNLFPVGPALLALPVVLAYEKFPEILGHKTAEPFKFRRQLEKLCASLIVAAAAVILFLLFQTSLTTLNSVLLSAIFAFCTPAWSVASTALWQHGPSMLMCSAALFLLVRGKRFPELIAWSALPLAFSFLIRPTNIISVALFSGYVFFEHRRQFRNFVALGLTIAALFVALNYSVFGSALPSYYGASQIRNHGHLFYAAAANLLSPSRGMFLSSPVLILSLLGVHYLIRNNKLSNLDLTLIVVIVLHWLVISAFPRWWGGHSFGARLFSDMTPYFVYLLIPFFSELSRSRDIVLKLLVLALTLPSLYISYRGANSWSVYSWNDKPVDIDLDPTRVWDWNDIQWLRGLRPRTIGSN